MLFDRSWYNRAGAERELGFSTPTSTRRRTRSSRGCCSAPTTCYGSADSGFRMGATARGRRTTLPCTPVSPRLLGIVVDSDQQRRGCADRRLHREVRDCAPTSLKSPALSSHGEGTSAPDRRGRR
ncbi:hypothetical protein AB0F91_45145 [Amycolatopsis sp. NPDC023774]|uniref:hypothetical protein n=1 Tax=Amycolatopsis sp. NPDC023774 TaxID=3155015 RepID=UPI0033C841A4